MSEHLLDVNSPGKGARFNTEQEVFEKIGSAPTGIESTIEAHQFAIRVDDHLRAGEGFLRAILRRVGFSPYSFGLSDDTGAAMTATEVDSKKDASVATFKARSGVWRSVLAPFTRTLIEVDAAVFGTGATVGQDLEVTWPPVSRESMLAKGQALQAIESARAMSTETKVRYLHPDWDDGQVEEEVKRIASEQSLTDPYSLGADEPADPVPAGDETDVADVADTDPHDAVDVNDEELTAA